MDLEAQSNPFFAASLENGKPSVISSLCATAQAEGAISCLWVCFDEHGVVRVKDIRVDEDAKSLRFRDLIRCCGWWKCISMYSVVDVQEVELQFHCLPDNDRIFAVPSFSQKDALLAQAEKDIEDLRQFVVEGYACGISPSGEVHEQDEVCPNISYDQFGSGSCPVLEIYKLRCRQDRVRNSSAVLKYYWAMRSTPCSPYQLRDAGFVYTYESLRSLHYQNAMLPYGQSIKAIYLVMGWSRRYITALIVLGVCTSIYAVVVIILITHDLDYKWSAGSYTAAIVSVVLALFSTFSRLI